MLGSLYSHLCYLDPNSYAQSPAMCSNSSVPLISTSLAFIHRPVYSSHSQNQRTHPCYQHAFQHNLNPTSPSAIVFWPPSRMVPWTLISKFDKDIQISNKLITSLLFTAVLQTVLNKSPWFWTASVLSLCMIIPDQHQQTPAPTPRDSFTTLVTTLKAVTIRIQTRVSDVLNVKPQLSHRRLLNPKVNKEVSSQEFIINKLFQTLVKRQI